MIGSLRPWQERAGEEANLFNPAFCALLLARAAEAYRAKRGEGLPYALAFAVLPAILHAETRDALPRSIRAVMHNWAGERAAALANFGDLARRVAPITKEAILFGLLHGKLALTAGAISAGPRPFPAREVAMEATAETQDCVRAATFLGRWFGVSGSAAMILATWGLRP